MAFLLKNHPHIGEGLTAEARRPYACDTSINLGLITMEPTDVMRYAAWTALLSAIVGPAILYIFEGRAGLIRSCSIVVSGLTIAALLSPSVFVTTIDLLREYFGKPSPIFGGILVTGLIAVLAFGSLTEKRRHERSK